MTTRILYLPPIGQSSVNHSISSGQSAMEGKAGRRKSRLGRPGADDLAQCLEINSECQKPDAPGPVNFSESTEASVDSEYSSEKGPGNPQLQHSSRSG